jgi:hypothetical protein
MEFLPLKIDKLDVSKINFSREEDGKCNLFGSIRYHNKPLMLRTPTLITEAYGIPRAGSFYKTDGSRAFYKMPLCHDRRQFPDEVAYDEIKMFHDKLKQLDEICGSDKFKQDVFGDKNYNKYNYIPIIRSPQEDGEENTTKYYKPPYVKLKLQLQFETQKPLLNLWKDKLEEKLDLNNIASEVKYLGKVSFIIRFNRLFIMNTTGGSGQKKNYGISLVATHAKVYPRETARTFYKNEDITFIDTDDEEEKIT